MGKKRRRDSRRKRSIGWYRYAEGKERRAGGRRWRSGDNGLSIWFLFSFFVQRSIARWLWSRNVEEKRNVVFRKGKDGSVGWYII